MHIKKRRQHRRDFLRALQYGGPELRFLLYVRDGGHCWYCGTELALADVTVDHVQPRHADGKTIYANVVAACTPCNKAKGHVSLEAFRQIRGDGLFYGEKRQQHAS